MSISERAGAPVVDGHAPGSAGYRRVMAAMFAAGLGTFVLLYATQALLPELHTTFGVSPAQATLSVSLTTAGLALGLLVAGPASEVLGRTPLVVGSVWLATAVAWLCPFAWSWSSFLALRLVEGLALAGLPAVATAYLREELQPSAVARATGLYIGGTAIGGMAGRLVTAPVADVAGWRWAMAAAAALALLCALAVTVWLPPSRRFTPRPHDRARFLAMSGIALRDPALRSLYLLGACSVGTLVAVFNALGFRLTSSPYHLSLGAISLLYLVYPLGTVSSSVSGALADRFGRRSVLPFGCLLSVLGVLCTLLPSLPAVVVGLACLTAGFFVMHGLASSWVAVRAHLAGASSSQAAAFYLCSYYVGSSVFGSLGGTAWSAGGWGGVGVLALVLLGVAGAAVARLCRTPNLTVPHPV
ncbi:MULTISPECIES: MFS transporter [unclassified Nocardioides]|uniref:MFS transporter n=1 Tax=unclassified Nocardioides TaxID=2615069 RepID=UPI000A5CCDDA|nr:MULTISPECIES: MFS transporter [unclassified Nocardioides]